MFIYYMDSVYVYENFFCFIIKRIFIVCTVSYDRAPRNAKLLSNFACMCMYLYMFIEKKKIFPINFFQKQIFSSFWINNNCEF